MYSTNGIHILEHVYVSFTCFRYVTCNQIVQLRYLYNHLSTHISYTWMRSGSLVLTPGTLWSLNSVYSCHSWRIAIYQPWCMDTDEASTGQAKARDSIFVSLTYFKCLVRDME